MYAIDKMYAYFAPKKGLERIAARKRMELLEQISIQNSGYDESGASYTKSSMKKWRADSQSPQQDIDYHLPTLRRRSRSLFMNSTLGRSAIIANRTNVVGCGLVLKPKVNFKRLGISKEKAEELNQAIKTEFDLWADSKFCDSMCLNNFAELQQIALLSWLMSGDTFAIPLYYETESYMPYQLRIQLVEADRISTPDSNEDFLSLDAKNKTNGNSIISGVEIDSNGRVVAYHVCNGYPTDGRYPKKWTRIEAIGARTGNPNILHIFNAERPEQYRGVPYLSPVIESIKQLTTYTNAEIMAAVINAMFTVFIKTEQGEDNIDFSGAETESEEEEANYELGNGLINYLKPGEDINIAESKRPNVNFDGFVTAMTKYIGAALEIPPEVLLKSFTNNYSASRGALLEAWKGFRMRRSWFVNDFCQPIYELWLAEAVAKERICAPGFFLDPAIRKAYCRAIWNGPAPGQLDPVKEVNAACTRVTNGFSTHEREATEMNGSDFTENMEQLESEIEQLRKVGLWENNETI